MAAVATSRRPRESRPPLAVSRRTSVAPRALDGAVDLALQLAVIHARHGLAVLAVSTVEGGLLAACGDVESSRALAAFAQLVLGREPTGAARTMHCGRMHLARMELLGEACVVTAMSEAILEDPEAIVEALGRLYETPPAMVEVAQGQDDAELDALLFA